jgi:hypothetical protein
MTDTPGSSQSGLAVDNGVHQLIGMKRAFHQRLDLASASHSDGFGRRRLAVLGRDDLVGCKVELGERRGGADLEFRPHQYRRNQIDARSFDGAG